MSELITPNLLSADSNGDPALLRHVGVRRLLVVSGEAHWVQMQAEALCRQTPGDWLWLGGMQPDSIPFSKARMLLGQEYQHAVFDARSGLDVEALAIVAGTLRAGSWLLLLVPPWHAWAQQPDADSLRWSEQSQAIATPNFITHFQQQLLADDEVTLWRQGEEGAIKPLTPRAPWQPASGDPTPQQQALLTRLQDAAPGVYVITAARGRGKSTLAGMLAAHGDEWQAPCLRSRRISRIAVVAEQRRSGIGYALIAAQRDTASDDGIDFLSVSFGYQPELWAFWQACGFRLVRIGSHREASSGCYSAMAILPISEEGRQLATRAEWRLAQEWPALRRIIPLALSLQLPMTELSTLEDAEWRSLAGFAFAHRGMEPTFAALTRLLGRSGLPLPALCMLNAYPHDPERGVKVFSLSGKKALLQRWREETAQALAELDAAACARWQRWTQPGGFQLNK
ncbi:GNAT family N-acetyltransferase [Symbiopectobacterium sp.]|uniref:GNAT family N-acetyltransferase n=1 Tax=Symbiopectobacterium sp. TaxID=2952789 RepID=UPI003F362BE7